MQYLKQNNLLSEIEITWVWDLNWKKASFYLPREEGTLIREEKR